VTKELTARTVFVPPSKSGPPESPKHVPPLFACSLMNSSLIELLLATSVVDTRRRAAGFLGVLEDALPNPTRSDS
jgi:hypothetical protein